MGHLTGYTDAFAVEPGQRVRLMVSSTGPYTVGLVRVLHGDTNRAGPGLREEHVPSALDGEHAGRVQPLRAGSHAVARASAAAPVPAVLTLAVWVFPTMPGKRPATLLGRWSGDGDDGRGFGLFLTPAGDLAMRAGDGVRPAVELRTGVALAARRWQLALGTIDREQQLLSVCQLPLPDATRPTTPASAEHRFDDEIGLNARGLPYRLAAHGRPSGGVAGHFDGKLDRPTVLAGAAEPAQLLRRLSAGAPASGGDVLAAWDLGYTPGSVRVADRSRAGWDAELVNMPTRAVTAHDWTGDELAWSHAPGQYGAVHFHHDDLEDAGWEADATATLPPSLAPGVYAARLEQADGRVDRVPFVVRGTRPRSRVAVLLPTLTYLAYGAEQIADAFEAVCESDGDRYATENALLSQYNRHADGSGVAYASWRRPLPTLRPDYRYWLTGHPHGLGADLYLLDWLAHAGWDYDLLTDEDVDSGTVDLLSRYRVVMTGSHPEYTTRREMNAFADYLARGGRLMYLGGNGFTMVTAIHPERPHVSEIRRTASQAGLWESAPGEAHLATTGEAGGRWGTRRETTHALVGVETVGMGFRGALPYQREPDSFDVRAAFVFEGVADDTPIGDFGLAFGGAAGYEVDGLDTTLGSPPGTLLLARARGFSDAYSPLSSDPDIRSDMVLFDTPNGGSVFSVGSIAWTGALSHNGYDNDVARITGNVLRRFATDDP